MEISAEQRVDSLLLYRVGPVLCCSPAVNVISVITPPRLTQLPGSHAVKIFRHNSGIVQIFDVKSCFGVEPDGDKKLEKTIIVRCVGENTGFIVDEIIGVVEYPEDGWSVAPACVPGNIFKRSLIKNKKIYLFCDFEDLLRSKCRGCLREYIAGLDLPASENGIELEGVVKAGGEIGKNYEIESVNQPITKKPAAQVINDVSGEEVKKEISKPDKMAKPEFNYFRNSSTQSEDLYKKEKKQSSPLINETEDISHEQESSGFEKHADRQEVVDTVNYTNNDVQAQLIGNGDGFNVLRVFPVLIVLIMVIVLVPAYWFFAGNNISKQLEIESKSGVEAVEYKNPYGGVQYLGNSYKVSEDDKKVLLNNEGRDDVITIEVSNVAEGDVINEDVEGAGQVKIIDESRIVDNKESAGSRFKEEKVMMREVIHVVVEGDTLWNIARHYINNPYRYPELARLSKIKNPDRIYPGDKVRIIINSVSKHRN